MKKLILSTILLTLLLATASAAISLETEPNDIYNLGDTIELSAKITPAGTLNDMVSIYLSCENGDTEIYKEYLFLDTETQKEILIPLIKEFIGEIKGNCKIQYTIGTTKETISNTFKISDKLSIELQTNGEQLEPGKTTTIHGIALKENGLKAEGTIEVTIPSANDFKTSASIKDGEFSLNIELPDNMKAGSHKISLYAYEKNKYDEITNSIKKETSFSVKQVPTNLEILLDSNEVIPGEELTGQVLLRDQTGEKIIGMAYIAIKNELNEIVEKIEIPTETEFKYPIKNSQPQNTWTIAVYSEELINRLTFKILEHKDISVNIVNQTVIITNTGNVLYNETVEVKIGDQIIPIKANVKVNEEKRYSLKAPTGEYTVQVGDTQKIVRLTGNSIKVQEIGEGKLDAIKIGAWIFIILILGLTTLTLFKKVKNGTFFGKKTGKKAKQPLELHSLPEPASLIEPKKKAKLASSITGQKQNAPMGCIVLKNYEEYENGEGGVKETMQLIGDEIEKHKGAIYENKGNFFFMLAPAKTKTFANEKSMIELIQFAKKMLDEHNKKFKKKINYGLSLNYGTIVTNETPTVFKFMSMGTLMTTTKKIANKSAGAILLGEKFKEKIKDDLRTERMEIDGLTFFRFVEFKEKKDHSAFINNFVKKTYGK